MTGVLPSPVELVVRCAATDRTDSLERRIDRLVDAGPDWERVVRVARANDVTPLLLRALAERESAVPDDVLSQLRATVRQSSMRGVHLVGDLRVVVDALDDAGIPALPFKGPALSQSAYGDPALRPFRDIDLLLPRGELSRAVDRLQSEGYDWLDGVPRLDDAAVLGGPYTPPLASEFRLHEGSTTVELRWQVGEPSRPLDLTFEELWARRGSIQLAGRETPSLSVEDRLLVLAHHGVKHRWDRLKWVCDVAASVRPAGAIDWPVLLERARKARARRKLSVSLLLAEGLLDAPVPAWVSDEVGADGRAVGLADGFVESFAADPLSPSDRPARIRYNALAADGPRDALASVFLSPWFHPRLGEYRLAPLPGPLHPVYYAVRPVRAATSVVGAAANRLRARLGSTESAGVR